MRPSGNGRRASAARATVGQSSSSGCCSASSSCARSPVSGLRSSCETSPTNPRCRSIVPSSRCSVRFTDCASSDTSSAVSGTVTRPGSPPVMSASSPLIFRTGRSARRTAPATIHATSAVPVTAAPASRPMKEPLLRVSSVSGAAT